MPDTVAVDNRIAPELAPTVEAVLTGMERATAGMEQAVGGALVAWEHFEGAFAALGATWPAMTPEQRAAYPEHNPSRWRAVLLRPRLAALAAELARLVEQTPDVEV